jgi:hypothetical protein
VQDAGKLDVEGVQNYVVIDWLPLQNSWYIAQKFNQAFNGNI